MRNPQTTGHLLAFVTILIWGATFISTKLLLPVFQPVEILFLRFTLGYLALWAVFPRRLKGTTKEQEITFALAGLCGVCLYYLLENIALTYTLATNVGVMVSIAPFFTAILTHLTNKGEETLRPTFFLGFLVAMTGICLISFQSAKLQLNPLGDLLAVLAALLWACYSVLTRRIGGFGYPTIQTTRRLFGYGLLCMLPALALFPRTGTLESLAQPVVLGNLLFLGLGASALCFVTWNRAVKLLGAVKTSVYIYMVPVITLVTAHLVLGEQLTGLAALGIALAIVGLLLSERMGSHKPATLQEETPEI